jgi:hypothetical protein
LQLPPPLAAAQRLHPSRPGNLLLLLLLLLVLLLLLRLLLLPQQSLHPGCCWLRCRKTVYL